MIDDAKNKKAIRD